MFWKKKEKQHSLSCASHQCKYDGDLRVMSNFQKKECNCDGYHSFDELYEHRVSLFVALCKHVDGAWRSRLHSDGTALDGWFVMGIGKERGAQITYHLPWSWWERTMFAETVDYAPCFDGHTSDDVLTRLESL